VAQSGTIGVVVEFVVVCVEVLLREADPPNDPPNFNAILELP
jgi:hypothetical protein